MTLSVVFKIYWQALKLRCMGTPFYTHPSKQEPRTEENT
jgi:DUF1365 family protein